MLPSSLHLKVHPLPSRPVQPVTLGNACVSLCNASVWLLPRIPYWHITDSVGNEAIVEIRMVLIILLPQIHSR